ncbi:DUF1127 domain-containing protein [Skermanella mucosa]|uniref:DUF1127 domain-containing protein n=1 Tax=Skermanella mucosa TaxID=1789672 RepID=UPI00192BDE54|nr:DUF1127 domain-containing protein [Skermanella mucosa]UEM23737.1 DUF1127 domain-containing protein [Skermanella mucosa]
MTVGIRKFAPLAFDISLKSASLKSISRLLVTVFDTLLDWQDRVRQRHRLGEMDDHLLRDIGLSRADLEREAAKPFWRA